jgi:hypothetical protein
VFERTAPGLTDNERFRAHPPGTPTASQRLGDKVAGLKKIVPTRPHPMSPDHPPFNALLGPGVGLIDRVRDALSGRAKG